MLKEFFSICDKLNFSKKKLLVAVSGGVDSMVLCHLLKKLNLDFSIAHVNYNLRGNDSYLDEKFISEYTNKNQIDLFLKNVDLSDQNNSIQNKAREIRFSFFNEIFSKYNFDFILTAHHLDDNIETIFLNISRGKKVSVFSGMNVVNDIIIKPLLFIEKNDIVNYAKQNNVTWREDRSNVQNKYLRNYIRNILIPSFRKINKNYKSNFIDLFFKAQKIKFLKDLYFKNELSKVFTVKNDVIVTQKSFWKNFKVDDLEFEYYRNFNFFNVIEIFNLIRSDSGKFIESLTHTILSNRNELIIKEISKINNKITSYKIDIGMNNKPIRINISKIPKPLKQRENKIYISKKVDLPLKIRKWKNGDFFYPIGMTGKKKVSKFFKDQKMSIFDKKNQWLLTSNNDDIIWIVGKRVDRRYIETKSECLEISI
jgi:tRNA(Ile)-lysidine synthase